MFHQSVNIPLKSQKMFHQTMFLMLVFVYFLSILFSVKKFAQESANKSIPKIFPGLGEKLVFAFARADTPGNRAPTDNMASILRPISVT